MARHTITRQKTYLKILRKKPAKTAQTLRKKPAKTLKWNSNPSRIYNTYERAGSNWNHWRKKVPRRRDGIPTGPWMIEFQRRGTLKNYNGTLTRSRTRRFKRRNMYAHETAELLAEHLKKIEETPEENSEEE
jgi:hypothetical protein